MPKKEPKKIAIIGGGAAGFFSALTLSERDPTAEIHLFEKRNQWLSKVKISGGGRCNVTHQCFDPKTLSEKYPRGSKELRAAFHTWQPQDTIDWFAQRQVQLKAEADGRMFPTTDDSQTIINCFLQEAHKAKIKLKKGHGIDAISLASDGSFLLKINGEKEVSYHAVCLALGSLKSSPLEHSIRKFGHSIESLAPSLFAFNVNDSRTYGLSGLSVPNAQVWVDSPKESQTGPLLITHRGMSGPAILKLSAWEARKLQEKNYHFDFSINWLAHMTKNSIIEALEKQRIENGKRTLKNTILFDFPRRLWESLLDYANISPDTTWSQLSKSSSETLIQELTQGLYQAQGKTTNKDEFVTCGGVKRREINFKRMESKLVPNLHFAGECIDLDGITGGFNFQAAWTTGRIAGMAMAE
ncbi:MAG: NAD(P)/FAD-dependent oxidoreductase [Opitutales bacterium]